MTARRSGQILPLHLSDKLNSNPSKGAAIPDFCANPDTLDSLRWFTCYLTTGKHLNLYFSVITVLVLLGITAPVALAFGFAGASAARSGIAPLRWIGKTYIAIVRGVPDIAFFLFFVIALDQASADSPASPEPELLERRRSSDSECSVDRLEASVLLVEDVPVNQLLIKTILTKAGSTVAVAGNGHDACEAVAAADGPAG